MNTLSVVPLRVRTHEAMTLWILSFAVRRTMAPALPKERPIFRNGPWGLPAVLWLVAIAVFYDTATAVFPRGRTTLLRVSGSDMSSATALSAAL